MGKHIFAFVLTVLTVSVLTENAPSTYKGQENITLVDKILNLGYSMDQKNLVVLQDGVQGSFMIYEGIRGNMNRSIVI